MTPTYWQAKADLCLDLAVKQMKENKAEAIKNINRALIALNKLQERGN